MTSDKLENPPESKLGISRNGSEVTLCVTVDAAGAVTFAFTFDAGSEWAAIMLRDAIARQISAAMETARKDAYEAGWKDHAGKKAKRTWFWGRWV